MKNSSHFSGARNAQQFSQHNNLTKFTSAEESKKNDPLEIEAMYSFLSFFIMRSTSISQGIYKILLINDS